MKSKISTILNGHPIITEESYAKVAREMPDVITRDDTIAVRLTKPFTQEERKLAADIRTASIAWRPSKAIHAHGSTDYIDDDDDVYDSAESPDAGAGDGGSESDRQISNDGSNDTGLDEEDTPDSDDVDEDESDAEEDLAPKVAGSGNIDPRLFDNRLAQKVTNNSVSEMTASNAGLFGSEIAQN